MISLFFIKRSELYCRGLWRPLLAINCGIVGKIKPVAKGGFFMKKMLLSTLCMAALITGPAFAEGGLVSVKSSHDVVTTANRLESALKEKGVTVFARIDHAAGAQRVEKTLKPTLLIIFGNPAMGTPLIQRSRSIGIDLPLKALIWEDKAGQVWFTYNAPDYLARRHGITEMGELIQKMEKVLSNFSMAATQP
jgi:uncharacterized protein (DUF302 family)